MSTEERGKNGRTLKHQHVLFSVDEIGIDMFSHDVHGGNFSPRFFLSQVERVLFDVAASTAFNFDVVLYIS